MKFWRNELSQLVEICFTAYKQTLRLYWIFILRLDQKFSILNSWRSNRRKVELKSETNRSKVEKDRIPLDRQQKKRFDTRTESSNRWFEMYNNKRVNSKAKYLFELFYALLSNFYLSINTFPSQSCRWINLVEGLRVVMRAGKKIARNNII